MKSILIPKIKLVKRAKFSSARIVQTENTKAIYMEQNYSYWLIEQYKLKSGIEKNREAAETLGLNEGNVSSIKSGKRHLTPEQALFIAEQCGLDIGEVLVKLDMEKAKSPAVREALGSVLKRIAGAVAAIALITGLMTTPASDEGPTFA